MTVLLVDPRSGPSPPAKATAPRVTDHPEQVNDLIGLCRKGRIYDVERWIVSGKPLQAVHLDVRPYQHVATPLSVAIESDQHDLALLLLCNGYNVDMEPQSALDIALRRRAWELVDLLLAWGAYPTRADPDAVLDTYQLSMMERFWDLGLDLTRERSLAYYLAESTRNKPAYGWAKRHHEDPRVAYALALALSEAVSERGEKAVALLSWAGADPHRQVPSLTYSTVDDDPDDDRSSAIERAVSSGQGKLLKYLSPDPGLDDFDELWESVCDPAAVDFLFDRRAPRDWSRAIKRNISYIAWWFHDREANRACLERIFDHHWGRLSTLDSRGCQDLRRDLLKIEYGSDFAWLLQRLAKPHYCDERIFAELVRTPAIRERMTRHGLGGLLPPAAAKRGANRLHSSRHVQPKGQSPENQHESWLASLTPEERAAIFRNLISREQLYEEVWAEPITKVAVRYGVSDVAVAKWCRKLNVPRPGRGYWARKAAGRRLRQWPLPAGTSGQPRYVSRPKPSEKRPAPPTSVPGLELFEKRIPVLEVSTAEHPLVAQTRRALAETGAQEGGIIQPRDRASLDVQVFEVTMERALRIMNTLIHAVERAGFTVEVSATLGGDGTISGYSTYAVVHEERIQFSLSEATQEVERPPTDEERAEMRRHPWQRGPFYAQIATGELTLQIEGSWDSERHRRTWSDSKHYRLEDRLHSFLRGVLITAESLKRRRLAAQG
jgi:hypothetical protein